MSVTEIINKHTRDRQFSFEVLPPLKGTGTEKLFADIDKLAVLEPAFINITTHHSEYVYRELPGGQFERLRVRRRPGTIAIAAAIQQRYHIPVQPHVICSGATIEDIEYELLDLQFLGIHDLLLLRGDKAKEDSRFTPTPGGHAHTTDLIRQVQRFNDGYFADGTPIKNPGRRFDIGVACYPEKHEEAPNLEMDMEFLKQKQELGAQYAVTQLFFDNQKYFAFVEKARQMGITIPIIPGIKPMAKLSQLTVVPKTFHCDIPEPLASEIVKCKTDEDARQLGIGQEEVRDRLLQMTREGRLPHAIMLCGPQGVGKKALAIAFASYLLGEDNAMVRRLEHPDLHFTYPTIKLPSMSSDHKPVSDDFAKEWHELIMQGPYFTMDEWMTAMGGENQQAIITAGESDALVRKLSLKSSQGGYKVSVIWLPERMNIECANKLLKLIEEPPQQTVFIMTCEEPDRLLETIRSRVQRIDVKQIPTETICQALIERRGISAEAARRISRLANGSWLKALEELQVGTENEQFLDLYISLMRLAYQRKIRDLRKWSEVLATFGREKQKRFLSYFLRMTRECFMYNFQQEDIVYMTQQEEDFARNFARFVNEANILALYDLANRAIRDIGQNANAKIVFFDFTLQTIVLLLQK